MTETRPNIDIFCPSTHELTDKCGKLGYGARAIHVQEAWTIAAYLNAFTPEDKAMLVQHKHSILLMTADYIETHDEIEADPFTALVETMAHSMTMALQLALDQLAEA